MSLDACGYRKYLQTSDDSFVLLILKHYSCDLCCLGQAWLIWKLYFSLLWLLEQSCSRDTNCLLEKSADSSKLAVFPWPNLPLEIILAQIGGWCIQITCGTKAIKIEELEENHCLLSHKGNTRQEEWSKGAKYRWVQAHGVWLWWPGKNSSLLCRDGSQSLKASASKADNTRILFLDMTFYIDSFIY